MSVEMDFDLLKLETLLNWRAYAPSAFMLIGSNVLTIIVALVLGLDPAEVIWVYWLESVVIGGFTILAFIAMAADSILHFHTGPAAAAGGSAMFFAVHYGGFHAGYAIFLSVLPWFFIKDADLVGIGMAAGILALSHGFSFVTNVMRNPLELLNTAENRQRIMMAPYSRIIPMHLTIILSGFVMIPLSPLLWIAEAAEPNSGVAFMAWLAKFVVLLLFMSLKTAADLFAHIARYRKG